MLSKRSSQKSLPVRRFGRRWRCQHLGVHAHHQHLLVVRAVEDADAAALGQRLGDAPEEVVIELLRARRLEGMHLAALRVDARHHVLDRAVLAGRVHRLEDGEHRQTVLRVELLLQRGQPLDPVGEQRLGVRLLDVEPAGVGRIEIREAEFLRLVDAEALDDLGELHGAALSGGRRRLPSFVFATLCAP